MIVAYVEYEPVVFPCLAKGCGGEVWVTEQKTLRWYHNYSGGARPGGLDRCDRCEAKIRTVTVRCLNEDTGEPGDHGCIANGEILLYGQNPRTAVWYVMNGCCERPRRMYPYCDSCRVGVVFTGPCRNRGCRGDGTVRCTGHEKQGLLFLAKHEDESSFWPPRNCQPCREFIASLSDLALTCSCCRRPWRWSQERQTMLVRNEPRSAFVPPELCDGFLALGDDERKAVSRRALADEKERAVRLNLCTMVRSAAGREALRRTSHVRLLEAARTLFRAPDRHAIAERVKVGALTRVARLGGDEATKDLRQALKAAGTDGGGIAVMLANAAITDDQALKVTRALGKLAAGNEFPKGFAERMKVSGGIRMDTGLARTGSTIPRIAQAAAYEIHAAASIADNPRFPYPFSKEQIATFHYRFQHNRYGSESDRRSYEGDIVIQHGTFGPTTLVDFKHSITGMPYVTKDELVRIYHGLERDEIQQAVIVSNTPLTSTSTRAIKEMNDRIEALNRDREWGDPIDLIRTFVQPW